VLVPQRRSVVTTAGADSRLHERDPRDSRLLARNLTRAKAFVPRFVTPWIVVSRGLWRATAGFRGLNLKDEQALVVLLRARCFGTHSANYGE